MFWKAPGLREVQADALCSAFSVYAKDAHAMPYRFNCVCRRSFDAFNGRSSSACSLTSAAL